MSEPQHRTVWLVVADEDIDNAYGVRRLDDGSEWVYSELTLAACTTLQSALSRAMIEALEHYDDGSEPSAFAWEFKPNIYHSGAWVLRLPRNDGGGSAINGIYVHEAVMDDDPHNPAVPKRTTDFIKATTPPSAAP